MARHKVGSLSDVPPGGKLGAEAGGIEVAVFNCDGELYAIQNRCNHKNAPLVGAGDLKLNSEQCISGTRGQIDQENCTVSCPWHWWEWDLETGAHVINEDNRLRTFDVEVDDGDVYVVV